ncbi:MAG: phosphodiester glycosidase family protein, partial [Myxococcales bacterium]|nr:phosphodiester glycosidase family protein [Myxococcales bacterium]
MPGDTSKVSFDQSGEEAVVPQPSRRKGDGTAPILGKGLDVGTANLLSGVQTRGGNPTVLSERNMFLEIPSEFRRNRQMLTKLNVPYVSYRDRLFVLGDSSFNLANMFGREVRRPMQDGFLSPDEQDAIPMLRFIVERLLGKPACPNEPVYFSVPAPSIDADNDTVYHQGVMEGLLKKLGSQHFRHPLIGEDQVLSIRRVSCERGLTVRTTRTMIELGPETRNLKNPGMGPCFYDLFHDSPTLPGDGRSIVRLVGNRIMEIVDTKPGENPPVLPVGLVVSFPAGGVPSDWKVGRTLAIKIIGLEGIANAVEAGPLLLDKGQIVIDMEREGWKTRTSIQTQAARIDYLDMRGPKIAIGLDDQGTLVVLVVNGRIRESVGATHIEMAKILLERGMHSAMGFDPGGSATLVVGG